MTPRQFDLFGGDDEHPYGGLPPHEPHARGETSHAAAVSMIPCEASIERRVYAYLAAQGAAGATDDEIAAGLGLRNQTVSARRRTLELKGRVVKTDRERPTRQGALATVNVVATTPVTPPEKKRRGRKAPRLRPYKLMPVDRRILAEIVRRGGASSDEVEAALGLSHQTVSAQISYMADAGILIDSGRRTINRSRRRGTVWTRE